jgi:hypothetical protein
MPYYSPLIHLEEIRIESLQAGLKDLIYGLLPSKPLFDHYSERFHYSTADVRGMLAVLTLIGFADHRSGPTLRWQRFVELPPARRRTLLRGYVEAAFSAEDGKRVAVMELETLPSRRDRVQWFADVHGLNRSTTATYAERIYRTVTDFLDTAETTAQQMSQHSSLPRPVRLIAIDDDPKHGSIDLLFYSPGDTNHRVHPDVIARAHALLDIYDTVATKEGDEQPHAAAR